MRKYCNELPVLPEQAKINSLEKLIWNLNENERCVAHIQNLKKALNRGLKIEKSSKSKLLYRKNG